MTMRTRRRLSRRREIRILAQAILAQAEATCVFPLVPWLRSTVRPWRASCHRMLQRPWLQRLRLARLGRWPRRSPPPRSALPCRRQPPLRLMRRCRPGLPLSSRSSRRRCRRRSLAGCRPSRVRPGFGATSPRMRGWGGPGFSAGVGGRVTAAAERQAA